MPSAGFLIYSAIMPLIKTFLSLFFGFVVTRKGLFPPAASRGASHVAMTISLPCLIFASVVPAFTPDNVSAFGPLLLIAVVYLVISFGFGLLIREICYIPRNFWQGIIILCGMSNWGNLPTAIVVSVTQQAPFNPNSDPALGVSYITAFIVAYNIVFFGLGGAQSLAWDYQPGVPQGEAAEIRVPWTQKPIGRLLSRYLHQGTPKNPAPSDDGGTRNEKLTDAENPSGHTSAITSTNPEINTVLRNSTAVSLENKDLAPPTVETPSDSSPSSQKNTSIPRLRSSIDIPPWLYSTLKTLAFLLDPINLTLIVSFPIALIKPLKALFVDISDSGGPSWKAPDGKPPLAFVMDTAQFLGDISIPLCLILLGASFARLRIPRPLSRLPIAAMASVTLSKMVLLPVIGVLLVEAMVKKGFIPKDAKVEKFVAIFLSGTPSAVNQLVVSSIYAPDGEVDTLSAFLLVQYLFMFISSSVLTAIGLLLI